MRFVEQTAQYLRERGFKNPEIGIILGTGLDGILKEMTIIEKINYNHIPHFPTATIELHRGRLIFGEFEGKKVVVMQGRFHLYEGYTFQDIVFPVRIMAELGIQRLLVSNASGALNKDYKKGDLMLINDHINLQGGSPLAYKGVGQYGNRFVDMGCPYDAAMNAQMEQIAQEKKIILHKGVYAAVVGPQLETRAEYRYLRIIGADAVGMSTVPEIIVANQAKIPVVAVSVLTDECDPENLQSVSIEDIIKVAEEAEPKMIAIFSALVRHLD